MNKENKKRINIYINTNLEKKAKDFCRERGLGFSEFINYLMKQHFKNKELFELEITLEEYESLLRKINVLSKVVFERKRR